MNFLTEIQITNDLQIVKLFNEKYCDKIKDLNHPTRISLLNNNKRLDNAILNTYELRQENRLYRARNVDLESLIGSYKLYIIDLQKELKQLKNNIKNSDEIFNDLEHGL